jgi:HPt (histidine-containing phosphotransfer) domain-containing protein
MHSPDLAEGAKNTVCRCVTVFSDASPLFGPVADRMHRRRRRDMDQELNELRREFLAEADEKVREIEAALTDQSTGGLDRLTYLAHQLKGSGGSYGYAAISADAAEIEKTAEKIVAGEASLDGVRPSLQQRVESLRSQIAKSSSELAGASA